MSASGRRRQSCCPRWVRRCASGATTARSCTWCCRRYGTPIGSSAIARPSSEPKALLTARLLTEEPIEVVADLREHERQTTDWIEDFVLPGYPRDIHAHLEPTLDEQLVAAIESQQAFLLEHGYIEQGFDVRAWIDPGPLAAAHDLLAAAPATLRKSRRSI